MNKKEGCKKKSVSSTDKEEICRLMEIVKKMPEIHQGKVDEVKKRIESGTYNISAESVAKSIVDHHKELTSEEAQRKKKNH